METIIVDVVGWIGSILLVIAYWLVSQNKVKAQSIKYQSLNIIGSLMLIINTFYYKAFPSTALNVIWIIIGFVYIVKAKKNE